MSKKQNRVASKRLASIHRHHQKVVAMETKLGGTTFKCRYCRNWVGPAEAGWHECPEALQ